MKCIMYTIGKEDVSEFQDCLPKYVMKNCEREGIFILGAADEEDNLIGLTQFYLGMLSDESILSEIIYVYVREDSRDKGVASRMLGKIHQILEKSGIEKSVVVLSEKDREKILFKENGYMFMTLEENIKKSMGEMFGDRRYQTLLQGVCWIGR